MRPQTPRGFRDALFAEAAERESVTARLAERFAAWGYEPVETPVVEVYRTLEEAGGRSMENTAFRFFDLDGALLALRPEMTIPIARVVASRLAGTAGPFRVRYVAPVFREHESLRGQARQFTQAGVEFVGEAGPRADAEVITLMVEALQATGLATFEVAVGTVGLLLGILEASGMPTQWRRAVIESAQARNLVGVDTLASEEGVPAEVAEALRAVPRIGGGREAIEACRVYARACGCEAALDDLAVTWSLLEASGAADRVRVDFGVMRSFDYYTGLVLEAYAPGLGLALGGGGRYDRLLETLDAPAAAAGFALGVERVMVALAEQQREIPTRGIDAVCGGTDAEEVLRAARRLRDAGWRVRLAVSGESAAIAAEATACGARTALLASGGELIALGADGALGAPLGEPVGAPPAIAGAEEASER